VRVLITIIITLSVLTGVAIWLGPAAIDRIRSNLPEGDQTLVRIAAPERGDLVELVQAPGTIEPEKNVELSARISARIIELPFDEGEAVKAGDVLIRLDASDYESSLRAAEARRAADAASLEVAKARLESSRQSIEAQKATLKLAKLDLERNRGLLETKDVAQSVVDQMDTTVQELKARLLAAEESIKADDLALSVRVHSLDASDADIQRLRDELDYAVIRSPIDGIVTKLNAEVGELVVTGTMNNAGTIIMEVADLSRMLLIAEIDESDVGSVEEGQPATVRINAYPGEVFVGEVAFVALTQSLARDGSKFYRTEILLDTKRRQIFSGLTADVEIETNRHEDVLKVPSQAVLARPVDDLPFDIRVDNPDVNMTKTYATVVYRYIDKKAVVTPVTIGAIDLTHTVILSGIDETDQVVIGPYKILETIKHDQTVKDEREDQKEKEALEREKAEADSKDETENKSEPATAGTVTSSPG